MPRVYIDSINANPSSKNAFRVTIALTNAVTKYDESTGGQEFWVEFPVTGGGDGFLSDLGTGLSNNS